MNKKNVFLNLLSLYGLAFVSSVASSVENKKFDQDDKIVSVDTERLLSNDEMNVFCDMCS